jgi:hypothetical protein
MEIRGDTVVELSTSDTEIKGSCHSAQPEGFVKASLIVMPGSHAWVLCDLIYSTYAYKCAQ